MGVLGRDCTPVSGPGTIKISVNRSPGPKPLVGSYERREKSPGLVGRKAALYDDAVSIPAAIDQQRAGGTTA